MQMEKRNTEEALRERAEDVALLQRERADKAAALDEAEASGRSILGEKVPFFDFLARLCSVLALFGSTRSPRSMRPRRADAPSTARRFLFGFFGSFVLFVARLCSRGVRRAASVAPP